ncbi:MAG: (2Fe-2S)-binding protein [Candidatus Binatia bacterium]|nr:MAG: (2Fe-2S)-binding protein [Candidatus Binatia bacterium]
MGRWVKVASADELPPGTAKAVEVEGRTIALFHVEGTFFAIDDACPHQGGPLSEGEVQGTEVTCPWHAANFDLRTGEVLSGPAREGVRAYATRVVGSDVEVELES